MPSVNDVLTALEVAAPLAQREVVSRDADFIAVHVARGLMVAAGPALLAVARAVWAGQDPKTLRDALAALTTLKVGG